MVHYLSVGVAIVVAEAREEEKEGLKRKEETRHARARYKKEGCAKPLSLGFPPLIFSGI